MSSTQNNNNNNRRNQSNGIDKAYTKSKDKSRAANQQNEIQGDHIIKMSSKRDQNSNYVINYMNRAAKLLLGYEPSSEQQEQKEGEQQQNRRSNNDSKVEKVDTVIISAAEQVISDALRLAALIRNKIPNLHQNIEIKTNEVKDVYEAKFKDAQLDDVVKERKITIVRITLTRSEAVIKSISSLPGYQKPAASENAGAEPQVSDLIRQPRRFNRRQYNTYNRDNRNRNNNRNNNNYRSNSQGRSNSNVRRYNNNNNNNRRYNNNRKQSGDNQDGQQNNRPYNNRRRFNNNEGGNNRRFNQNNNGNRNQGENSRRQNNQRNNNNRNHNGRRQNNNNAQAAN